MGILAPMAWNLAGACRNSLISWSSSMASSAPATSAKVVLGVSLVISFARDLPKFMTREPPPCIWFMMNRKIRTITMIGRKLARRLRRKFSLGTSTVQPSDGLDVSSAWVSWTPCPSTQGAWMRLTLLFCTVIGCLSVSSTRWSLSTTVALLTLPCWICWTTVEVSAVV